MSLPPLLLLHAGTNLRQSHMLTFLQDVETLTATVDLDEVASYRASIASLQEQASSTERIPCVEVDFALCGSPEAFLPMRLSDEVAARRCVVHFELLYRNVST